MAKRRHIKVLVSEIRKLAMLHVSTREAAAFFGIRLPTFLEMLRIDEAARTAWEEGLQHGKISIRRKQFRLANTSASMAMFLGKQYLDQRDVSGLEVSGADGGPVSIVDVTKLDSNERKELRSLLIRTTKQG